MAFSDNDKVVTTETPGKRSRFGISDPTRNAFFWLSGFFIVYCARPEDWIPGLKYLPLAKLTAIPAMYGLYASWGKTRRSYKDIPKEGKILLAMIGLLYLGAFLSPIWRGGAIVRTLDFSKVFIAFVLIFLIITTFDRLRRIIFIQVLSVIVVCAAALIKGHDTPRMEGVLGGIYSNPNDLAFAIVLSMPFALAFMITAKNALVKVAWLGGILIMAVAIFETASRAGFIDLVISGTVALYYFAIKGKRPLLILGTAFIGLLIMVTAGGTLYERFAALSGQSKTEKSAYGSYEDRKYLMLRALDGIEHYPILGLGVRDFATYSLIWHDVHMSYLQICVEGGIPVLILYLMFFYRGFKNLRILRRTKNLDPDIVLFVGALQSSLVGFVVGACFAPEAYQYFPYFAVAFTAALLQIVKEREEAPSGTTPVPTKKPRHFLEVYANRGPVEAGSRAR